LELRLATGAAEEILFAVVQRFVASGRRIHIHTADRVFRLRFGGGRCGARYVDGVEVVHSLAVRSPKRIQSAVTASDRRAALGLDGRGRPSLHEPFRSHLAESFAY